MKFKAETCKFIPATDIVPDDWSTWFWEVVSSNAPFLWADNDRTLITASRFADHCEEVLEDCGEKTNAEEIEKWLKDIRELGETYIDLEN